MVKIFCVTCAVIGYPYVVLFSAHYHFQLSKKTSVHSNHGQTLSVVIRLKIKQTLIIVSQCREKKRLKFLVFGVIGCE